MIQLPPLPDRIKRLPKDDRGYPVPWFIAWMKDGKHVPVGEGKPDFRVIAPKKLWDAVTHSKCWVCGIGLGVHRVYVVGPMCVVNRVTSEPPSHRDCAEFAVKACPFMIHPREKRSEKNLPENRFIAGIHIDRNPGAYCLYETRFVTPISAVGGGVLFSLGPPDRVDWYAEGRQATRAEIVHSIETGYPILFKAAMDGGGLEAVDALKKMHADAMKLLPVDAESTT